MHAYCHNSVSHVRSQNRDLHRNHIIKHKSSKTDGKTAVIFQNSNFYNQEASDSSESKNNQYSINTWKLDLTLRHGRIHKSSI